MARRNPDIDPRGLIADAYRIEGISPKDCRTIFFDWVLGLSANIDPSTAIGILYDLYAMDAPDHPMTTVLAEGTAPAQRSAGRRRRRRDL